MNSVHDDILSEVNDRITAVSEEVDVNIGNAIEDLKAGKVPAAGKGCINYIRSIRINALKPYQLIKAEIYDNISIAILRKHETGVLKELQELTEAINTQTANKEKAEYDKKHLKNDILPLPNYEKFDLYGEINNNSREEDININPRPIDECRNKFKKRRTNANLIGIAITCICAMLDYSFIHSSFIASNLSPGQAILLAFIFAIVLDAPPYIFGVLYSQKNDTVKLRELRNESNSLGTKDELKLYKIWMFILGLVILILFITYFTTRLISFFGGGDFNEGFHLLINRDFSFKDIHFNISDLLFTVAPLATSVIAAVCGVLTSISISQTDYIKRMIIIISEQLNSCMENYDKILTTSNENLQNLERKLETAKYEIWALYFGDKSVPEDDSTFRKEIATKFQHLNLKQYQSIYQECCILLRERTENKLGDINAKLITYVANQGDFISMNTSVAERQILDSIWTFNDDTPQHDITSNHLKKIQDLIEQLGKLY